MIMQFLDLKKQYQSIKQEIDSAIKRVLDKGVFIGGEEVEEFEKEIAEFCNSKYAIGVNSGTDALYLSLKALEIGKADEVITTGFSFISTAEVIANLGAKPVFVDIDAQTFNIDASKIEEKITDKTKAIIPVHLFGQMADMDSIMKRHNLYVIEDACQAIGAESKTGKAGSIGHLGCFSFFPSKNLSGFGDGGMVVTNNKELADKIRLLKNHGSSPKEKYLNLILGANSRLDALQAAVLRVKLKELESWNKKRAENALYYSQELKGIGDIITPLVQSDRTHIFHQYTIRTKKRDELQEYLKEKAIPTMIYYSIPFYSQPIFKRLNYNKSDFPETEKASREVLSLPIYPELSREEQDFVIKSIKDFFEK